jgi:hypothetical protein
MSVTPDLPPAPAPPPAPGLPPVQPPSVQVAVRLFLVPALIVLGLVGLFLAGPHLARWVGNIFGHGGDNRTAAQFLKGLDSSNPEKRWRTASDLAQVLLRKEELASDVDFALALSDRLQNALDESAAAEKDFAAKVGGMDRKEKARALQKLEASRNYIMFLTACLGNMIVPVGAPQLAQMALQTEGMEPEALLQRRLRALWALATLGENVKRFNEKLSEEAQAAVLAKLEQAANAEKDQGPGRATKALAHLRARQQGRPDLMGLGPALVRCADNDEPSLRYHAAFTMTFWVGSGTEEEEVRAALLRLADDDGRGEQDLEKRLADNPDPKHRPTIVKRPGYHVRPQAGIALARRGSADRLDLLADLLDEERLNGTFVLRDRRGGPDSPDRALVAVTMTNALKALAELHRLRPKLDLKRFHDAVEALVDHPSEDVRNAARATRDALKGGG